MPIKPHPIKYKPNTALLPQVTPVQLDIEPAQATLVAVAPLQSQPNIVEQVPGQLVNPSLKAHKALASDCCLVEVGAIDEVGDIVGEYEGT